MVAVAIALPTIPTPVPTTTVIGGAPAPVIVPPPWEGGDGNAVKGHERTKLKVSAA